MPRDSNGNASLDPVYKAVTGTTIQAVQHNTPLEDITSMLTGSVARNGAGGMAADLNMNGFTVTNLAGGGLAPADGSVTTAKVAAQAITPAKVELGAWTDVASASTVDLGAQASRNLRITGTTAITSFGAAGADDNVPYLIRFAAALTLTNGASLILPGAADITTAADDVAVVVHDTASVWRVVSYARKTMAPSLADSEWSAGTSTTIAPISPASLDVAITALGYQGPARGTAVAASGQTTVDFSGIPSTARRITVLLDGVSTNGSSPVIIRTGGAGGFVTTGYVSAATAQTSEGNVLNNATDGLLIGYTGATNSFYGALEILNSTGNAWVASGSFRAAMSTTTVTGGGITLSEALTSIRITTSGGTDTFDAGTINIFWE